MHNSRSISINAISSSQDLFGQHAVGQHAGSLDNVVGGDQIAASLAHRRGKDLDHLGRRTDQAKALGIRFGRLAYLFRRPGGIVHFVGLADPHKVGETWLVDVLDDRDQAGQRRGDDLASLFN